MVEKRGTRLSKRRWKRVGRAGPKHLRAAGGQCRADGLAFAAIYVIFFLLTPKPSLAFKSANRPSLASRSLPHRLRHLEVMLRSR